MPKVFISYSHDSESHSLKVLEFCNRLRHDGIDAYIDRYETAPAQGWPRWMVTQVEDADYVLVVCTEIYRKRFDGKTNEGAGVRWEGALISQELCLFTELRPEGIPDGHPISSEGRFLT